MSFAVKYLTTDPFRVTSISALVMELQQHDLSTDDNLDHNGAYDPEVDLRVSDEFHLIVRAHPDGTVTLDSADGLPEIDPSLWHDGSDSDACYAPFTGDNTPEGQCTRCGKTLDAHPNTEWIAQDVPQIVSRHLIPGEVAVFTTVTIGSRGSLSGEAHAINSAGERKSVALADIDDLAAALG